MKGDGGDGFLLGVVIGLIAMSVVIIVFVLAMYESTYKDAQIDALTGTVKYELVDMPNGEVKWQKIK